MLNGRKWRQFISAQLLTASIIIGVVISANGAWGDFDTSFGTGGTYQETAAGYQLGDVVMQPDGKILVTGSKLNSNGKKRFFLRRYLSNGTPDTSFGNNGSAVINTFLNANYDYGGVEVRMLSYSKIIVLGYSGNNLAVWMVNGDGYGNTGFGYNGFKVLAYSSSSAHIGSISGKPVICFYNEDSQRVVIIKLNVDGTQDMTFGTNGISTTNILGSNVLHTWFQMITEAGTNKITVAGMSQNSSQPSIRLERKLSNGAHDFSFTTFGHGVGATEISYITGLEKLSSGEYIYGILNPEFGSNFSSSLSRTSSSGVLEERISSGTGGKLIGIQPDGKIVVETVYFMARYDEDFNWQDNFQLYPNIDYLQSRRYTFQADNKMIVAGIADDKLTLARLLAD